MRHVHLVAILVLLTLTLPASPAQAGGVVSTCDESHLTTALTGGGTVTFTCSGTITLTGTIIVAANTTIDGSGQTVTLSGGNAVRQFKVNSGVTLTLDKLTIANAGNSAIYLGSGSSAVIRNSTFSGNSAPSGAGGAIFVQGGSLTITGSTFSGNTARIGGALYGDGGTLSVTGSSFIHNGTTSTEGGAIYSTDGALTVSSCSFEGNAGTEGGAIMVGGSAATVINSTFYNNSAATEGGGVENVAAGTLTMVNSTLAGNSAPIGGAISNYTSGGTVTLRNTIVADSPTGGNCHGAIVDGGGNLSYPDTTCPGANRDPILGPLQNNGGPTKTMSPSPGSAAIDAASDASCEAQDQRGITRPQGSHCDIGAYEVAHFAATKTQDDNGECAVADCALREAIIAANTRLGHDAIDVSAGTHQLTIATPAGQQDGPSTGDLDILDDLTIRGASTASTIVHQTVADGVFEIPGTSGLLTTVQMSDLTVENGSVAYFGGGILNEGNLILLTCKVQNNTAGYDGAGVYSVPWSGNSFLTVRGCTFSGNRATRRGGGIYSQCEADISNSTFSGNAAGSDGGGIWNTGDLTVSNSTFDANQASSGGGVYNQSSASVSGSTFSRNSAVYDGGGVSNVWELVLANCTFYGNNAGQHGGGYFNNKYNMYITNSTFSGNGASGGGGGIYGGTNVVLENSIVANSAAGGNCGGSIQNGLGNLSYPDVTCPGTNRDPMLSALGNNGGPTQTMALRAGSPAIDSAAASNCASQEVNNLDQRGYSRPVDGNGDGVAVCDMGAFEYLSAGPPSTTPDEKPPKIWIDLDPAAADGANEWYRSPVTVNPKVLDASPVIGLRCALDPGAVPTTYDELPDELCPFLGGEPVAADGQHAFYAAAMDIRGNKSAVASVAFQIDATPPVITCPAAGPFLLGSGEHSVGPAGVDASVSGLDDAASTLSGIVATDSVGSKTLTFTAFDMAGNSASQECTYAVIYDFGGFYPPVEPAPALNEAKAGRAVPLKFSLAGDQGLDIIAESYPASQPVDCDTLEPTGPLEAAAQPGRSGLSYAAGNGWYHYDWKTDKAWAGPCRALVLKLVDGTVHSAYLKLH